VYKRPSRRQNINMIIMSTLALSHHRMTDSPQPCSRRPSIDFQGSWWDYKFNALDIRMKNIWKFFLSGAEVVRIEKYFYSLPYYFVNTSENKFIKILVNFHRNFQIFILNIYEHLKKKLISLGKRTYIWQMSYKCHVYTHQWRLWHAK